MPITKQKKQELVKTFQKANNDTGSPEVQIALITERINSLTGHFKHHVRDHHSRYGLIKLVSDRKRLLKYLKNTSPERYEKILEKLDLRK
ncbi:MAG: 30S ribosomal protein S15 [Candidatus Omnitrophica bacterium]|nr:30S ribosomal protein S15 [Candidatus Omnitrophota bacterium]